MAKKKLTEEQERDKKLQKLYKYYLDANQELDLEGLPTEEQIRKLVYRCCEIQGEICKMSDTIKIDDLVKVQELTPIDKKTYMDFVNICSLKNNDKLKDKAVSKFENDFNQRLFITNLRHSFLNSYMKDEDLKITDEDNEEYKPFTDYKSEEFDAIMQESAKKREYLNLVLWRQYKNYAKAAEYITQLELGYKDFKNLTDWEYYKDGGYPSPTSPSKIWSIFDKFNYAHRLLNKWGFDETASELNKEFGLNIKEVTPQPVDHPWKVDKENTID